MASTKITELTAANTIAVTDVLPFVSDPSGSPTTKKITANNLANSILSSTQVSIVPASNVSLNLGSATRHWNNVYVKTLYANGSAGSNGFILASNGTATYWTTSAAFVVNTSAGYTWTNNHTFSGGVTFTGSITTKSPTEVNILSNVVSQLHYNPNSQVSSDYSTDSAWVYTYPGTVGSEVFVGNTLGAGLYVTNNAIQATVAGSSWTLNSSSIVFPDSTEQSTAVNKVGVPATSTSSGSAGEISWDSNSIYVCVGTNQWKKVDLVEF